jgi:hypothetical protein
MLSYGMYAAPNNKKGSSQKSQENIASKNTSSKLTTKNDKAQEKARKKEEMELKKKNLRLETLVAKDGVTKIEVAVVIDYSTSGDTRAHWDGVCFSTYGEKISRSDYDKIFGYYYYCIDDNTVVPIVGSYEEAKKIADITKEDYVENIMKRYNVNGMTYSDSRKAFVIKDGIIKFIRKENSGPLGNAGMCIYGDLNLSKGNIIVIESCPWSLRFTHEDLKSIHVNSLKDDEPHKTVEIYNSEQEQEAYKKVKDKSKYVYCFYIGNVDKLKTNSSFLRDILEKTGVETRGIDNVVDMSDLLDVLKEDNLVLSYIKPNSETVITS